MTAISTETAESSTEAEATLAADQAPSPAEETPSSTLGGELVAGLIGAGIAVGCVLPPLLHLITGPLGPFIGGFVAGNRQKPSGRGTAIIAVMIGTGVAGLIGAAAQTLVALAGRSQLPHWFPSPGTLGAIVAVAWLYAAVLGAIGVTVSRSLAQKKEAASSES